jgi:hypothetical protein
MAQETIIVKAEVQGGESVGSLKKQLREAQQDVQALSDKFGATSDQAVKAAKRAAELKDAIGDAKALTDAFNPDRKFQAFASALQGVIGGISAFQGAMGLLGVENENVEKTLLKVQSAMALSQGINSVLEARDSFKNLGAVIQSTAIFQKANNAATTIAIALQKAFGVATIGTGRAFTILKGAIAATGIGLLVVGLTTLIGKISEWTSASEDAANAQKKLAEQNDVVNASLQNQIDVLTAVGNKEKEILGLKKQQIDNELNVLRTAAKAKGELTLDELKKFRDLKTQKQVLDIEEQNRLNKIDEDAKKKRDSKYKEDLQKQKENNEKIKEQRQQRENDSIEFENEVEELRNKKLEENLKFVADREKQFEEIRQDLSTKLENRIQSVIIPNLANQNKIRDEFYEADLQATKDLQEKKFQAVNAGLDLIGALAGKNEAVANVIYTIQKAIEIGRIVSSTSSAIAQVSAQTAAIPALLPPGVPNPAFPAAVALGAKKIAGLKIGAAVNIASIVASSIAKFKGGAGGSNVGGTQQTAAVSGSIPAPVAPQTPQAQLTQLDQTTINRMGSATNRTYVLESDVTNSQERITRINRAARLN